MVNRSRILLIGSNKSWLSALEDHDVEVWLFEDPTKWVQRAEWTANLTNLGGIILGSRDFVLDLERLYDWARWAGVEAVIPGLESGVRLAAALSDRLSLPGLGTDTADLLTDKAKLRNRCAIAGLPQPIWSLFDSFTEVSKALQAPAVLKPTRLQASEGVTIVRTAADVPLALDNLRNVVKTDSENGTSSFLIEELLDGVEYSTEVLVKDGEVLWVNVTRKYLAPGVYPVEVGHDVPARIPSDLKAQFDQVIFRLVGALNVSSGLLHAEWIVRDGIPFLIECAGRAPGDYILSMAQEAWAVDVYQVVLDVLRGRTVSIPDSATRGCAIRYLVAGPGVVTDANLNGVDQLSGTSAARLFVGRGDEVSELRSSWDRCGFVRVASEDTEKAAELADNYAQRVLLNVEV